MKEFDFVEKVEFTHCVKVDTDNEELFDEVASDIAYRMDENEIEDKDEVIRIFAERFGADKVTFVEDGSGDVEYECF